MKTKKWYQSATLWFNVIDIAFVVADKLLALNILDVQTHAIILAVGNIILRLFKTDSATTL